MLVPATPRFGQWAIGGLAALSLWLCVPAAPGPMPKDRLAPGSARPVAAAASPDAAAVLHSPNSAGARQRVALAEISASIKPIQLRPIDLAVKRRFENGNQRSHGLSDYTPGLNTF